MDQTQERMTTEMREGDVFACPHCGCRITLQHHGDAARMQPMRPFTCCCGTEMTPAGSAER
jgi:hypothetical protein